VCQSNRKSEVTYSVAQLGATAPGIIARLDREANITIDIVTALARQRTRRRIAGPEKQNACPSSAGAGIAASREIVLEQRLQDPCCHPQTLLAQAQGFDQGAV